MNNYKDKNWLQQKYLQEKLSTYEIATLINCTPKTVNNWLHKFGIPVRDVSEAKKEKYKRSPHPWWGKKHSQETKDKISINHADVSGTKNPMFGMSGKLAPSYGKKLSKEERLHLSDIRKGKVRLDIRGELNPNWKGGKTPLITTIRNHPCYKEWRLACFTRDSFTCTKCHDSKGGSLEAHHMTTVASIVTNYNLKTIWDALGCDVLWDISNGITLCKGCHNAIHRQFTK